MKYLNEIGLAYLWQKIKMRFAGKSDSNYASYLAFVDSGHTLGDVLDAAFGKNNEDRIFGIGNALAMFAWSKGETGAFSNLIQCDNLAEIASNSAAVVEIIDSNVIYELICQSNYAYLALIDAIAENYTLSYFGGKVVLIDAHALKTEDV